MNKFSSNFSLDETTLVDELQCTLKKLIHKPTGAKIIHLENDDPENVFCLAFKTYPESSNGVAHILEHSVFCGSKKFPVKDTFFYMNRRSLNTYLNALTGPDFTCYPAASQIERDFYNLLSVYADAVFNPTLEKLSFMQEGHRFEFSNSDLVSKGVVFNEMKGALSSPMARFWEAMLNNLFPDIVYSHNSGGCPSVIPTLTHKKLKEFHQKYYQPSRCLFYFYGDLPLKKHLDFLEEHVFSQAKKHSDIKDIPLQKRFTAPKEIALTYPLAKTEDKIENKAFLGFGWLTCHLKDQDTVLALALLETILMGTDAALLKIKLLKSGLCQNAYGFLDEEVSELPFIIILEGCDAKNLEKIHSLINATLKDIVKDNINPKLIAAALHQFEFHRTEVGSGSQPFGLQLFFRLQHLYQHGGQLENGLKIHSLFDHLRTKIKDPNFLPSLIKSYFLNNPHLVKIALTPDTSLSQKEEDEEKKIHKKIANKLSNEQKNQILSETKAFEKFQKKTQPEDIEILPKICISDVSKKARHLPLNIDKKENFTVYSHNCFTNNILYVDLNFKIPSMPEKDLPFLQLFSYILPQVGAGKRNYKENLEFSQIYTGGMSSAIEIYADVHDYNKITPILTLHAKALGRNMSQLFELIKDTFSSPQLTDRNRLTELIKQHYIDLETDIQHHMLRYASLISFSGLTERGYITNKLYGLDYFYFIKKLAHSSSENIDRLIEKLKSFQQNILMQTKYDLILSSEKNLLSQLEKNNYFNINDLNYKKECEWNTSINYPKVESQARIVASPVAFICMAMKTVPYSHKDSQSLNIASALFENTTLHNAIREIGGAYGSSAANRSSTGRFFFSTYRDPNIFSSIDAFHKSVDKICKGDFTKKDIEEAQFAILQKTDSPISPCLKACIAYTWGKENKTLELRQKRRDELLSIKKVDIQEAVKNHLSKEIKNSVTVVFANKELLKKENTKLKEKYFSLKSLPI